MLSKTVKVSMPTTLPTPKRATTDGAKEPEAQNNPASENSASDQPDNTDSCDNGNHSAWSWPDLPDAPDLPDTRGSLVHRVSSLFFPPVLLKASSTTGSKAPDNRLDASSASDTEAAVARRADEEAEPASASGTEREHSFRAVQQFWGMSVG